MFTGIIESIGTIKSIEHHGNNTIFWVASTIAQELKIDQSVSHNGICLTIEAINEGMAKVTAVAETLEITTAKNWKVGEVINLERCMSFNGRLDGHIVQGHVDCTALCLSKKDCSGSWEFRFSIPEKFASLIIEKGAICINGTSLTIFNISLHEFSVAIIPYTFYHTNLSFLDEGSLVNIEFDLIGKYINRIAQVNSGRV